MHFTLASLAFASSALAANHMVMVGKDATGAAALAYDPPVTTAAMGDTVTFQYYGEYPHTVTEANPMKACEYMSGGFFSGELGPGSGSAPGPKEFVVTINDTKPIWFICSVPSHCSAGMVGVINGPMSDYTKYKAAAMKFTGTAGSPSNGKVTGGVVKAVTTSPTTTSPPASSSSSSSSAGTTNSIAGGAIAIAAVALGFLGL